MALEYDNEPTIPRRSALRQLRWEWVSVCACFLFGVACLLNAQPANDGMWFWYAVLRREGLRLYADLHLSLQPLFILLNAAVLEYIGTSWRQVKSLAVVQLVAYLAEVFWIALYLPWRSIHRACLIAAVFALTIAFSYYRFDDYHTLCNIFALGSVLLVLSLAQHKTNRSLPVAILLGVFAGLSLTNRINDGAGLLAANALCLMLLAGKRRFLHVAMMLVAATFSAYCVIHLAGDTVADWSRLSIFRAAAIKGGTENVLLFPVTMPFRFVGIFITDGSIAASFFYMAGAALILCPLPASVRRYRKVAWAVKAAVLAVLVACLPWLYVQAFWNNLGITLCAFFGVVTYVVVSGTVVRAMVQRGVAGVNWRVAVLLIPFFQLLAAAMTGGSGVPEIGSAIGINLILFPLCFPRFFQPRWRMGAYLSVSIVIIATCGYQRYIRPFWWHNYTSAAMFSERETHNHPLYGPMYIERSQRVLFQRICETTLRDGLKTEMLSIPYAYPNYFCGVRPWHGYVQTWYDTSSKQLIDQLMAELVSSPPRWIVYERSAEAIAAHEKVYGRGTPLPHRALDKLIMDRVAEGEWRAVMTDHSDHSDRMVIETRP